MAVGAPGESAVYLLDNEGVERISSPAERFGRSVVLLSSGAVLIANTTHLWQWPDLMPRFIAAAPGLGVAAYREGYLISESRAGRIVLFPEGAEIFTEPPRAGLKMAEAGDLNGDGIADLAIGDPSVEQWRGAVYLLTGPVSAGDLADADGRHLGEFVWDAAGAALQGAGDRNGDGFDDLLIGAYGFDDRALSVGAAYLVDGPDALRWAGLGDARARLVGRDREQRAGWSITGLGDRGVFVGGFGAGWILGDPIRGHHRLKDAQKIPLPLVGPVSAVSDGDVLWVGVPTTGAIYRWP